MTTESDQNITLRIAWTDHSSSNLNARIAEFKKRDGRVQLDAKVQAIQFLRGVASRASFVLPAFYEWLAAGMLLQLPNISYWRRVQAANAEFSSLNAISATSRAIFDDAKSGLTGKVFARAPDFVVPSLAKFWSEGSDRGESDATKALELLRRLFERCARPRKILLDAPSLLERRIGLLKCVFRRS